MSETIYEHAGGIDAFRRLTRIFYVKVKADPDIGPLFRSMSPEHPDRVALWLAEVFGGPVEYTRTHGGYPAMVLAHVNRGITETQRARWAALLYDSLDEAGLPDDERFRRTFRDYVEWGTRIARRNSQVGFTPPAMLTSPPGRGHPTPRRRLPRTLRRWDPIWLPPPERPESSHPTARNVRGCEHRRGKSAATFRVGGSVRVAGVSGASHNEEGVGR